MSARIGPPNGVSRRIRRVVRLGFMVMIGLAVLLFFFGFFIKTTDEYACAVDLLRRNPQVVREIGEPIRPGLFAWTIYFESGGATREGAFFTLLSGPRGRARARVQFYRTPVGATLTILLKTETDTIDVYDGPYACP